MIFLLSILIILLLGIFSILLYLVIIQKNKIAEEKISKPINSINTTSIDDLVHLMKQDKEEKMMKERDLELRDYANKHNKLNNPVSSGMSSLNRKDLPVNVNRKNSDLIPYNLSESERAIIEEFYR